LVSAGLNENEILVAFSIFKTDLCNNMPYGERTYLEGLSKDLNKYRTVRDTLHGLNTKILIKKIRIDKLAGVKSKLEIFLFSLVVTIYFYYSVILNAQVQIQKNLRIVLLISNFNYLPLLCIITKPKKLVRSKFKIQKNNKKRRKEKETKSCKGKKKNDK
jgi:hypothetical protein